MNPEEIKVEIYKRRKENSMEKIGKSLDPPCSRQAVFLVIERKIVSKRIMKAVAEAIGKDVRVVFPDYFLKRKRIGKKK